MLSHSPVLYSAMETTLRNRKAAILFAVVACIAPFLLLEISSARPRATITYSQFLDQLRAGQVTGVDIEGTTATSRLKTGKNVRTEFPPDYQTALNEMQQKGVSIEIHPAISASRPVLNAVPFLLLLAVWFYLMKRKPNLFSKVTQ